jgi:hypothetical protein
MHIFQKASLLKNYELVSKAKIDLHLFQKFFTPHTPPLKQGESETTLSPDLPSTHTTRSTIPFHKCFKSRSPMSDLVTRYSPQATTRFTMPSFSPWIIPYPLFSSTTSSRYNILFGPRLKKV